jgi:octaprenyl-diphosphate synthase
LTVNATEEQRQALKNFGENLGLAFQIKDDLLDYEGNSGILGKPALADLEDKKITLPLIYALDDVSDKERRKIFKMIKNGAAKKELKYILQFVNEYQGLEKAWQKADNIKGDAIRALAPLPASPAREALTALAEFVLTRKN